MSRFVQKVGIVGTNVKHSLSPAMHNAAYQEMGLDLEYGVFELPVVDSIEERHEKLHNFLESAEYYGVVGFSVTMPFKENVLTSKIIDFASRDAQDIGAANTIHNFQGTWFAHNTDYVGAQKAIEEAGIDINGKKALVIGAGGTAKAITYGLAKAGASIVINSNRTRSNASQLIHDMQQHVRPTKLINAELSHFQNPLSASGLHLAEKVDIVYNATSVGQIGESGEGQSPVSEEFIKLLKPGAVVADVVYSPLETPLLKAARQRGDLITVDGTRILLRQAEEQARIFTGKEDVPVDVMEAALKAELQNRL